MRFSDGVNRYHNEKKESILNSVLDSAQSGPSNSKDREGIIMTTNENNIGSAKVKTKKSGIIAAACAVLVLGGAVTFFAMNGKDGGTDIKTSPMAQPGVSSAADVFGERCPRCILERCHETQLSHRVFASGNSSCCICSIYTA